MVYSCSCGAATRVQECVYTSWGQRVAHGMLLSSFPAPHTLPSWSASQALPALHHSLHGGDVALRGAVHGWAKAGCTRVECSTLCIGLLEREGYSSEKAKSPKWLTCRAAMPRNLHLCNPALNSYASLCPALHQSPLSRHLFVRDAPRLFAQ